MNGRHSTRATVRSTYSGSLQFAHTNQGHRFWQAVRELAGASAPKSLEQGPARQKIDNGSLLNGPTLSWRVLLWHPWCELSGCRLLFRADRNLEGGICDRAIRCPPRLRHDAPHNPEMAEDFPHYNRDPQSQRSAPCGHQTPGS